MDLIKYFFATFFLLIVMSQPTAAAGSKSSYSKSVQQGGTSFDISSRPAVGCTAQIVTVSVRRAGKKTARLKADVDYLARSAQAVDLNGDGNPELAIFSRTTGTVAAEALDVYWLDGTTLRRSKVPELDENSGYKGGDRFQLEDRLIVRTVPVYRDGDPVEKPTGGIRTLMYGFKEGAFTHYVQSEKAADTPADSRTQSAPQPVQPPAVDTKSAVATAATLSVTGITVVESGIEIRTNGAAVTYKTMKLEKPERIAIDIPGADSALTGKKTAINRFGISTVRLGSNKGFLRVVLDSTLGTFPKYQVKSFASGILVEFTQ